MLEQITTGQLIPTDAERQVVAHDDTNDIQPVPQHPFVLIEENARHAILEATQNGEIIQVPRLIGRVAMALGVGIENGKTRDELYDRYLYVDKPSRGASSPSLGLRALMGKVRPILKDYAPPIVVQQQYIGDKSVYLYYYEDAASREGDDNFELWDADSTCIRFDKRTNYLTIAHQGVRTSARVVGPVSQKILEYLLLRPNEAVYGPVLFDHVRGPGKHANRIGTNVNVLKSWIEKHLKHDPSDLLETEVSGGGKEKMSLYTLHADRVEIIDEDGSMHLPCEAKSAAMPPVDAQALAALARGLALQRNYTGRLRRVLPGSVLPDDEFLAGLADTLPANGNARQFIAGNIDSCLRQLRNVFDSEDAHEVIRNWSPDDGRLKTFTLSLKRFDRLKFNLSGNQVRGIDLLGHLFGIHSPF